MKKMMMVAIAVFAGTVAIADNTVNITSGDLTTWDGYDATQPNCFFTTGTPLSYYLSDNLSWSGSTTYANFPLSGQSASFELDLNGNTFTISYWGGTLSTISGTNPYANDPMQTSVSYLYKNGTISTPSFQTGHENASVYNQTHTFDAVTFANFTSHFTANKRGAGSKTIFTNGSVIESTGGTLYGNLLMSEVEGNNEVIFSGGAKGRFTGLLTDNRDNYTKKYLDQATREAMKVCEKVTVTGKGTSLTISGTSLIGGGVPGALLVDNGATASLGATYINHTNDGSDMGASGSYLKIDNGSSVKFTGTPVDIGYTGTNNALIVDHNSTFTIPDGGQLTLGRYDKGANRLIIDNGSKIDVRNGTFAINGAPSSSINKEFLKVDNGSEFRFCCPDNADAFSYYLRKSELVIDHNSIVSCTNGAKKADGSFKYNYLMLNDDGAKIEVKNGSTFYAMYIFVGEGTYGKNNTLLVENANINRGALWFGGNGNISGGNNKIIFRGQNARLNGTCNFLQNVVFRGQGDILELDNITTSMSGSDYKGLQDNTAAGCYGTLRLLNGAMVTLSTTFQLNHTKKNTVEVLSGSELHVANFMQGSASPTRDPASDLTLKIGSGAKLTIDSQYQMAGTNNTLIIDNGTLEAKGEYPFYFAQSIAADATNPAVVSTEDNYITFMGAQPRIMTPAQGWIDETDPEHPKVHLDGAIAIRTGTVKFVLDPAHPYTEPVLQAQGNVTVEKACKIVFENIEETIEQMQVDSLLIPIASTVKGACNFIGGVSSTEFKTLNAELAANGAQLVIEDNTLKLRLTKHIAVEDGPQIVITQSLVDKFGKMPTAADLVGKEANGLKVWENYVLGIDGTSAEKKPLINKRKASTAGKLALGLDNVKVNTASGVTPKFTLKQSADNASFAAVGSEQTSPEFEIDLPSEKVKYYKIEYSFE